MIEIYLPEDGNDEKLTRQVQPEGWEHLAGPFSWCVPASQELQEDEDGPVLPVQVKDNAMGALAKHFHEHRTFGHSNLLFIGPPGNGKSAVEKFLAWTYLSDTHEPVSYQLRTGERATLVHHQTGEPFEINPTNEGTITYDFVIRKLSDAVLPEDVDPSTRVQLHNAADSDMNKSSVSALGKDLRRDLSMIGRRVVVISEIHDFSQKSQTRPLKTQIDPANMPEGLLVMADANSRADARKALGDAGFERFKEINASQWHVNTLQHYAEEYFGHFGVEFSEDFEKSPAEMTAERAGGSIRSLLKLVQDIREADQPLSQAGLKSIFRTTVEDETDQIGQDLWKFLNRVSGGGYQIETFINELIGREVSPQRFLRSLCSHLAASRQDILLDPAVQAALSEIRNACHYTLYEGPPANSVVWTSLAQPLDTISRALQNQNRAAPTTSNGHS